MKPAKFLGISLLLAGAATLLRAEPFRTDINPALQYYRAFLLAPDLSQTDKDYLFTNDWRGQRLPERFGELIARYNNQFMLIEQAAHSRVPCDWGIDMTPGPATLLPQLARNKIMSQVARLRAAWDLQQHEDEQAKESLVAAFVLARNTSRDGTLIAALVQYAMENLVTSMVAENFYQFSPETLEQLVEGFDTAPARGTIAHCIIAEKAFFRDWLSRKIRELREAYPGDDAQVMAGVHQLLLDMASPEEKAGSQQESWEHILQKSGGTSQGVLKLVEDLQPFYDRLAESLALPPAESEQALTRIAADIPAWSNPFASMLLRPFPKCRNREIAVLIRLAMVRAAVAYRLHGESGLKSVLDPWSGKPFEFHRFKLNGVDRGFELTSSFPKSGQGREQRLIFVEKPGPPFLIEGPKAGTALNSGSSFE